MRRMPTANGCRVVMIREGSSGGSTLPFSIRMQGFLREGYSKIVAWLTSLGTRTWFRGIVSTLYSQTLSTGPTSDMKFLRFVLRFAQKMELPGLWLVNPAKRSRNCCLATIAYKSRTYSRRERTESMLTPVAFCSESSYDDKQRVFLFEVAVWLHECFSYHALIMEGGTNKGGI